MNTFLKEKLQASNFPSWAEIDEQKEEYIASILRKENVQLDKDKIMKNPGKRTIAKLLLNSFWGKLCQKPNMVKTIICRNYAEYWKIINDDGLKVEGEDNPNDKTVILCYKQKDVNDSEPGNTSIAISTFVTMYARLHLYTFMEFIDNIGHDRLLYFDTDSVIYVKKQGDPVITCGDFLGDMTDEIASFGVNAVCEKFVSLGPKNYGLQIRINDEIKSIIKTKGIRNDGKTLDLINMKVMIEMVKSFINGNSDEKKINQWRVLSHRYKHFVKSQNFLKVYRVVSE